MTTKIIQKLNKLLNDGKELEAKMIEKQIADKVDGFVENEDFYSLPIHIICGIIDMCEMMCVDTIVKTIENAVKLKSGEAPLLLNVIRCDDATMDECVEIFAAFRKCPICQRLKDVRSDENLPFVDIKESRREEAFPSEQKKDEKKRKRKKDDVIEKAPIKEEEKKLKRKAEFAIKAKTEFIKVNAPNKENANKRRTKEMNIEGGETEKLHVIKFSPVTKKPEDFVDDIIEATSQGLLSSVQYLVEQCHADTETKDSYGDTPLHVASREGHLDIVQYLCEKCHANTELKNMYGSTPLHYASNNGRFDVVRYLVEACHASIEEKDNFGDNSIDVAGKKSIREYLMNKGKK